MIEKLIILLGLPGSGKGTQGEILSKSLKVPHISTGEIFRHMALTEENDAKVLGQYLNNGKLVPSDVVNRVVKQFFLSHADTLCILDGYPRTIDQLEYLTNNICTDIITIFFDINDDVAMKRILGRMVCVSCRVTYNKYFDQPKIENICDKCGASLVERSDDNEATVLARLQEYRNHTLPILEYCKTNGQYFAIDGGKSMQKVAEEVESVIKMV